jgi:cytochrome c
MASTDPRRILASLAVLSMALISAPSEALDLDAASAKTLFNDKGCNACHGVEEMRIGPPYLAIGMRYASEPPARLEKLAAKIRFGGAGAWGVVPMVSNPQVSQDEAEAIARWILSLGKPRKE